MSRTGQFDTDTQVSATADGVFSATVTEHWNAPGGSPNGGYSLGLCVSALAEVMKPLGFPDPLVVSTFFLRRTTPGPAEIHTDLARAGRRMASGGARLLRDGQEIVRTVATFADLGNTNGRTLMLSQPPELPPPDDCVDLLGGRPMPGVTIIDRYDFRAPAMPGFARGRPSGDPTLVFWLRFRDGRDADTLSLAAMVDAAAPAVMELGERSSSTLELTVHIRARPAPGWLACRVTTRHVIGGYHEENFEIWDRSGQLVAESRQLALLPDRS